MATVYFHFLQEVNQVPPVITLPYEPPDSCALTGGNGDGDGDGDGDSGTAQVMYSTVAIILLPLMTVFF